MKNHHIGLARDLSMIRLVVLREETSLRAKEAVVAEISIQRVPAEREFDGKRYVLTKIDYTKEDAEADQKYHSERGREVRVVEEGIFWLVYTKIGL